MSRVVNTGITLITRSHSYPPIHSQYTPYNINYRHPWLSITSLFTPTEVDLHISNVSIRSVMASVIKKEWSRTHVLKIYIKNFI